MKRQPDGTSQGVAALSGDAVIRAQQRAMAGQLALELMHDLRNPLEALGHLTYLALQNAEDSAKVRRYLSLAQEQMVILCDLATQPLDLARGSETSKLEDLVPLLESALRIHRRMIESKKIHLLMDCAGKVMAPIYRAEILQVVSNLVGNALDALSEGGTLHLRLRARRTSVVILVADNGHGISQELGEIVFEPFFTTKGTQGSGLGLALSKRIIEQHCGKIHMRSSVRPGRNGTVFLISLPV